MRSQQKSCFASVHGSRWLASARVSGPWPGYSDPADAGLQWSGALRVEVVDMEFFRASQHLIRNRCCTSDLRPPTNFEPTIGVANICQRNADSQRFAVVRHLNT